MFVVGYVGFWGVFIMLFVLLCICCWLDVIVGFLRSSI